MLCLAFSIFIHSESSAQYATWAVNGNTVSSDSKLGTNTGYDLIFETNNIERMRLTDAGFMGIGTNLPEYKLDLLGDMRLNGNLILSTYADQNAPLARMLSLNTNGSVSALNSDQLAGIVYEKDCFSDGVSQFAAPQWQSTVGTQHGVLFTGYTCPAWVGIGESEPLAMLHVNGSSFQKKMFVGHSSAIDSDYVLRAFTISDATGVPAMELDNEGRFRTVYYGTTGDPVRFESAQFTDPLSRIRDDGGWDVNYFGSTSNVAFGIYNPQGSISQQIAAITGDGKIWCQGIQVKHVPFWGDFVFAENYPLLPLKELEQRIKAEGKLPDMPSEKQVLQEGLDMASIVSTLTVKVEELTLYIIEQQKQLESMQEELNQLKK